MGKAEINLTGLKTTGVNVTTGEASTSWTSSDAVVARHKNIVRTCDASLDPCISTWPPVLPRRWTRHIRIPRDRSCAGSPGSARRCTSCIDLEGVDVHQPTESAQVQVSSQRRH